MSWFFWKKDKYNKELEARIAQLDEKIQEIKGIILRVDDTATDNLQLQEEHGGQLTKLTRLQYKAGQDTQGKLEQVVQGLLAVQQWQQRYGDIEERVAILNRQREYGLNVLVAQLDDLDMVCAGLSGADNDAWQPLFRQWTQRLVTALAEMGVYEVDVVGKAFDPQVAEGVGVVERPAESFATIPYEVAEVVKRGFISSEGQVLRKAQVITYREGIGSNE